MRRKVPVLRRFAITMSVLWAVSAMADDRVVPQLRWDQQFQFKGDDAARREGHDRYAGLDVEARSAMTAVIIPQKPVGTSARADTLPVGDLQAKEVTTLTRYQFVELGQVNQTQWARMHKSVAGAGLATDSFDAMSFVINPQRIQQDRLAQYFTVAVVASAVAVLMLLGTIGWNVALRRHVSQRALLLTRETEERRRAVHLLRVNQARLADVQRIARIGNWESDLATGSLWWSDEVYRIFGLDPDRFTPTLEGLLDLVYPADRASVEEAVRRNRQAGTEENYEHRIVRPDGEVRFVQEQTEAMTDEVGRSVRLLGTVQDITDRWSADLARREAESAVRRSRDELEMEVHERTHHMQQEITERRYAEAALRQSEERLRMVLENVVDGIITSGDRGVILSVNPATERIFGYGPGELVGQNLSILMAGRDAEKHDSYIAQYSMGGPAKIIGVGREVVGRRKDGTTFPIDLAIGEMKVDGNRAFTGIIRDITERKEAEAALTWAKEEAERANRAKSNFLSNMSHELRTPMNAILGFGQLLQHNPKQPLAEKQSEYVDYILHSAKHLLDLIDEVLDLTRIETGNVGISLADLDPEPIVKEALAIVQTLAGERDIDVSLRYLCATCAVRADHKRLRQVLFNLLSNAIKYNGPGGEVSVTVGNEGASFIRIEVTDAGPGIPIERQGELFQPFNRLGAETSDVEGTGIGLSLCKHLVELMGGTIGFKPATGGGTTFWFRLPAAEGDVPDCDSDNATQSTNAAMVPYLHPNRTVLCIGDGPENLELLCQIAARVPGASVERGTAETLGSEPIDAIQPDALLVDLDSVVRLNPGFLQSPRTASGFAGTPIVAVASERHANELPAETMGAFFRFLVKPYGVRQLIEILETALGSSDENSSRSPEHQLERAETTEI